MRLSSSGQRPINKPAQAFVTHSDCAPESAGRRRLQAIGTKNLARRKNSRAEFVRFLKVTRAGWHDVNDNITQAELAGSSRRTRRTSQTPLVLRQR